jgi:diadenosine tetraphosphate (Ap4A) HIT family hydrolase
MSQSSFADLLPLRPGHTLIVPKIHCSRVSELPQEYAAAVGKVISLISKALTKGASLSNHDL